ncbi:MAG: polyketide cyclase [Solirubrobacteraceae bacterium]
MTPDETRRRYPCDDIVPDATLQAWRGVSVRATPEAVWPWVAQIRLGPYSYDWIDNLGRRSPQQLKRLSDPDAGKSFTKALGGRRFGRIVAVTPGEQLTARIPGVVTSYLLVPDGLGSPRAGAPARRSERPAPRAQASGDADRVLRRRRTRHCPSSRIAIMRLGLQ